MVAKKKYKYTFKTKSRIFIVFLFFSAIIGTLCYTLFNDLTTLNKMNQQMIVLNNDKEELKEKEDAINADIKKLSDLEYIAKYAREKYFYSKDGELILRILD